MRRPLRSLFILPWLLALLLALPALVTAQTRIQNPTGVVFTASPDHALIDSYDLEIVDSVGTVIQTLNVGKPTPDATNTCTIIISVQPIKFGSYTVRMHAIAAGIKGPVSPSSDVWDRAPGPPSKPKLQ